MNPHEAIMEPLLVVGKVLIGTAFGGKYVVFVSDLDVCTDGTGQHYNDKSPQDETAYYNGGKFLNADEDQYIVIPPQVRSMVDPVVMGCQARATNLKTGKWFSAVTGEIGPDDKTGEAAICLARKLNPKVTANSGDSNRIYLYELWPGMPAVVDGKKYKLEPAGG
ncbi:MAG TPA: glycoside hydrolase family 75 protein [Candidatus Udaeobacter sp.]|nr:glycoside hydrolase family 75 protein [Candidatus Udaeobacter sp.]